MSLPRDVFAPAFRRQHLGWFMTLLIGIMVYLASFAMAAEAGLSAITFTWDHSMQSRLTVEVPPADDESPAPQTDRVQQVLTALRGISGVKQATPIPDAETARLLEPWISQPDLLQSLPLPSLIDVERGKDSKLTAADLQDQLKPVMKGLRVSDHAAWLADLSHAVQSLGIMALLTIVLTGITLIVTVGLVCRAIAASEHETITLLHVMGADDKELARHFQIHAKRLAVPSSFTGFVLAMISAGVLLFFLRNIVSLSSVDILHWLVLGGAVILVPLAAIWAASWAARFSVLNLLHRMP